MRYKVGSRLAAHLPVILFGALIGLPFITLVAVVSSLSSDNGTQPSLAGGLDDLSSIDELKTIFNEDQGSGRVFLLLDPI